MAANKKLILIVIDGLAPAAFEDAIDSGRAPALAFLTEAGRYGRAISAFPSLTPVCLASIATGAGPDVHWIPHLVWYHRGERRFVEYGSSFGAIRAAGTRQAIRDTVVEMNRSHLGPEAVTIFETLERAGLVTASVNLTCYRGGTLHRSTVPGFPAVKGPKRFFYYSLFESEPTGAPIAVRTRAEGSIDAYSAAVSRWLVTRDGFDFLVHYLPDYDYASHARGPADTEEALTRSDAAVEALMEAAGGRDAFLERYAVILCADHAQTPIEQPVRLEDAFGAFRLLRRRRAPAPQLAVAASNRAGMVYRLPGCTAGFGELAALLDGFAAAETVLFREEAIGVARREGEELRFAPAAAGWETHGDEGILSGYPSGFERAWRALANPNAGDLVVSAAEGYEFADLGGRHHAGGGSHGSLAGGDSEVPMVTVGLPFVPPSIVDVAALVAQHFGVEPPLTPSSPPVRLRARFTMNLVPNNHYEPSS